MPVAVWWARGLAFRNDDWVPVWDPGRRIAAACQHRGAPDFGGSL